MIAILTAIARERAAFAGLCASRGWPTTECDSVRAFTRLLGRISPRIVLTRHKLADGYSDDVITAVTAAGLGSVCKLIVLIGAGATSSIEVRQIALGADCIQRDPVRTDVLIEYLAKYYSAPQMIRKNRAHEKPLRLAGAVLNVTERTLQIGDKVVPLTPRETELARVLVQSAGEIISYDVLFTEILGRPFHGDTSNMRVLLGKLSTSAAAIGIGLRNCVDVIPKAGYRYRTRAGKPLRLPSPHAPLLPAA